MRHLMLVSCFFHFSVTAQNAGTTSFQKTGRQRKQSIHARINIAINRCDYSREGTAPQTEHTRSLRFRNKYLHM